MNLRCILGHKYKKIPTAKFLFYGDESYSDSFIYKCEKCGKMKIFSK